MTPSLPSLLLISAALIFPQSPAPKPAPATDTTFHSDALHLDYTYGSRFVSLGTAADDAVKEEKDKATGVMKGVVDCVSLPLTGMDTTRGLEMIMILRIDGECMGVETPASQLGPAASSALTESLKRFGEPTVAAATDYQVAHHSASTLSASVTSPQLNGTYFGAISCVLQGKNVVCWEFISNDCSKLPSMMSYPVKFEGEAAEPLVPARLIAPCKTTPAAG